VRSRMTPTSVGPTKPPRFADELIEGNAPAAAVPLRNEVPSAQKGPIVNFKP